MPGHSRVRPFLGILLVVLVAACAASGATPSPTVGPASASPSPASSPSPDASPSPASSPSSDASPSPAPSQPVVPVDWVEVARLEQARAHATAGTKDGLVAVGCRMAFEDWWDCTQAAAWTWTVHGGLEAATVEGAVGARMWDVAMVDGVLYAFGGDVDRESFRRAVIWRSTDGTSWERVDDPTFEAMYVTEILSWDGGLLAIGGNAPPASEYGGFAVWRSADGLAWEQVPVTVRSDLEGGGVFGAIATDERLVAWGRDDAIAYAVRQSLLLTSTDGRTWTRVPAQPSLAKAEIRSVIASPDDGRLVAVGAVRVGDESIGAGAWTSPDGVTWTRGTVTGGPADESMGQLGAGVEGLLARGSTTTWSSADGSTWTALPPGADRPDVADSEILPPVAIDGGRLALGFPIDDMEDETRVPVTLVWMSPSAGP